MCRIDLTFFSNSVPSFSALSGGAKSHGKLYAFANRKSKALEKFLKSCHRHAQLMSPYHQEVQPTLRDRGTEKQRNRKTEKQRHSKDRETEWAKHILRTFINPPSQHFNLAFFWFLPCLLFDHKMFIFSFRLFSIGIVLHFVLSLPPDFSLDCSLSYEKPPPPLYLISIALNTAKSFISSNTNFD